MLATQVHTVNTGALNGKAVQLSGREEDLQHLARQFCFDDFCIHHFRSARGDPATNHEEEHDEYYLKSRSFDSKANDREISSEAVDILALINGEAQLEIGIFTVVNGKSQGGPDFQPVQAENSVTEFRDGKRIGSNVFVPTAQGRLIPSDYRKCLEGLGVEIPEDVKKDLEKRDDTKSLELVDQQEKVIKSRFPLLELVNRDENVREALTYYGYQHSWGNLFRTWEVIKKDMGYRSSKGWKSPDFTASIQGTIIKGNENRFSQTANYHRHGGPGREEKLPDRPMDLDEAELLMRVLMLYWLNWKHDNSSQD